MSIVRLSRQALKTTFFALITHENISDCVYPCPCGYYRDAQKACTRASAVVTKYQKESQALCWIGLIFTLKFLDWIMKG